MATRQYEFVNGPETSALPSTGDPSDGEDLLSLDYAEAHYAQNVRNTFAAPYALVAATSVPVTTAVRRETVYVAGAGGVVMVAAKQIADGEQNGQRITLVGTSDTNYGQFKNGNGLDLNGDMVLYANCRLECEWDDDVGIWRECSRRG